MELRELRQTIMESEFFHWNVVETGPYFTDAPDIDEHTVEQHDELLVLTSDVDITIQHGLRARGMNQITEASQLWENAHFPDPSASVHFVDVFYRGNLVDRESVVWVDGARAAIPLGSRKALNYDSTGPRPDKVEFAYTATAWQAALATLADHDREWANYTKRAGITVEG